MERAGILKKSEQTKLFPKWGDTLKALQDETVLKGLLSASILGTDARFISDTIVDLSEEHAQPLSKLFGNPTSDRRIHVECLLAGATIIEPTTKEIRPRLIRAFSVRNYASDVSVIARVTRYVNEEPSFKLSGLRISKGDTASGNSVRREVHFGEPIGYINGKPELNVDKGGDYYSEGEEVRYEIIEGINRVQVIKPVIQIVPHRVVQVNVRHSYTSPYMSVSEGDVYNTSVNLREYSHTIERFNIPHLPQKVCVTYVAQEDSDAESEVRQDYVEFAPLGMPTRSEVMEIGRAAQVWTRFCKGKTT